MTIDERLEKLVDRHEALTQTVEMLVLENRAAEARMQKTESLVGKIADGIHDLLIIARSHEQRI